MEQAGTMMTNIIMRSIDVKAKEIIMTRDCLHPCLHIPIAARDKDAIEKYIGTIVQVLHTSKTNDKAFLVQVEEPPELDRKFPIWKLKESVILHRTNQVWVHVDYRQYRNAYKTAFPDEEITNMFLDHVMNRKAARLKGFNYLRIIPISRQANTSSGSSAEQYGVKYHSTPEMINYNKICETFIQYADVADIVKMLNMQTGGSFQDGIRDALNLFFEEKE
ncbi:MAG: hypothetical protein JWO92_710 [Chitinophagaceae bacterium]|nr:hypothetical protein [Chitinophagaceae bacterium]